VLMYRPCRTVRESPEGRWALPALPRHHISQAFLAARLPRLVSGEAFARTKWRCPPAPPERTLRLRLKINREKSAVARPRNVSSRGASKRQLRAQAVGHRERTGHGRGVQCLTNDLHVPPVTEASVTRAVTPLMVVPVGSQQNTPIANSLPTTAT
jgi:hypothetical protein